MSLTIVNAGEQALLEDGVTGVAYVLRLFKTDVTAGLTVDQIDALDETDFTEATFTGYSAAAVATGGWSIVQGNPTRAVNVEKQFTSSANQTAQDIWGYYVTRTSDGALIWFESFPAPITVEFLNDRIDVTPAITLDDSEGNAVETGLILPYGGATAPTGYLVCDGAAVSRTTYAALFAVVGTAFGAGNGSTTFNVPDLRQRFPLGKAASGTGATLGGTGGTIDHVHDLDTASSHAQLTTTSVSPHVRINRKSTANWTRNNGVAASSGAGSSATENSGAALGGDTDTANPPFQAVTYIVKT